MFSFVRSLFDKAPRVPDPGQRVLLFEDGTWRRGHRAVSGPITSETGEAVILVADEEEFREARWDERPAEGEPRPVALVKVPRSQRQQTRRKARRQDRNA